MVACIHPPSFRFNDEKNKQNCFNETLKVVWPFCFDSFGPIKLQQQQKILTTLISVRNERRFSASSAFSRKTRRRPLNVEIEFEKIFSAKKDENFTLEDFWDIETKNVDKNKKVFFNARNKISGWVKKKTKERVFDAKTW